MVSHAPLDVSVLAGLLSANPQSAASHLTLRLREKRIPSAYVPELYDTPELGAHQGELVRVVAGAGTVTIESIDLASARALWDRQRPDLPPLRADLSTTEWASFGELSAEDAAAYGTKAANLGEIHRVLPQQNRPDGFAIPFHAYADFIAANALEAEIDDILVDEALALVASARRARLQSLRNRLRSAPLPEGVLEQLVSTAQAIFGSTATEQRLRFRSSTNAEDLVAFSGAGLYDSFSGCLADDLDADESGPSHCLDAATRTMLDAQLQSFQARRSAEPTEAWLGAVIDDSLHRQRRAFGRSSSSSSLPGSCPCSRITSRPTSTRSSIRSRSTWR